MLCTKDFVLWIRPWALGLGFSSYIIIHKHFQYSIENYQYWAYSNPSQILARDESTPSTDIQDLSLSTSHGLMDQGLVCE